MNGSKASLNHPKSDEMMHTRCRIMHALFIQSPQNHFIIKMPVRPCIVHVWNSSWFSARQPKSRKGFIIYEIDLEFMRFKVSAVHRALLDILI
jgi:hypothetical protein